jgi:hypothetical protein
MIVDRTGHFASAFVVAAILAVLGMLAFGLIVRRIEPIDWRTLELSPPARVAASRLTSAGSGLRLPRP